MANESIYHTEILKSILCDYNNTYILLRGNITVIGHVTQVTQVAFKNCAPFTKHITRIGGTIIDDAEDLDLVMLMYNMAHIILKQQEAYGFIQKMKQLIYM